MARSSHEVKVRLTAQDDASREIDKVDRSFKGFATSAKVAFAAVAGAAYGFVKALKSVVSAAQEQENAVKALDASLATLGPTAASVSKELQEQAAALQKVSRFGDETIIKNQALLRTMGVSAEKMKDATQATVDLAAAFGWSLDQAARNVGRTMGGFAGELGEIVPELKDLDAAALKSGAGVDLLAQKFAGRAQADVKTFSGLVLQMSNAWNDLTEQVGFAIIENDKLLESLTKLRDVMSSGALPAAIAKVTEKTSDFVTQTIEEVEYVYHVVAGLQQLTKAYVDLGVAQQQQTKMSELQRQSLNFLAGGIPILLERLSALGDATTDLADAEERLVKQNDLLAAAFEKELRSILNTGKGLAELREEFEALTQAQNEEIDASDNFIESLKKIGVVLESDVSSAMQEHNRLLNEADALYRRGEITRRDFEAIERAVAEANREANDSLRDQTEILDDSVSSYESAAQGADTYAQSVLGVKQALDELKAAEGGSSFGGTLSGGSKLFPDSAVANTAIRNGVAVDVRGQGFRN